MKGSIKYVRKRRVRGGKERVGMTRGEEGKLVKVEGVR